MKADVGGGNQRRSAHNPMEKTRKKTSKTLRVFRNLAKNKPLGFFLCGRGFIAKLMQLCCVNVYFVIR
jgi:hypothetical protein